MFLISRLSDKVISTVHHCVCQKPHDATFTILDFNPEADTTHIQCQMPFLSLRSSLFERGVGCC